MKHSNMWKIGLALAVLFLSHTLMASPIGVWKTIDDETGKAKSYVQIFKYKTKKGEEKIGGKIIKLINPSEPDPICTKCPGWRKNKKIIGLMIITGVNPNPDGGKYEGGRILSPSKGKIYTLKMWNEGNNKLKIRGYIGFLYRTQTWYRIK